MSSLMTEHRAAAAVLTGQLAAVLLLGVPGCLPHSCEEEPQWTRPVTPDRADVPPA